MVNGSHKWIWYVHLVSYLYVIYAYFLTDMYKNESSQVSKIWIPLDIILTVNIAIYY